MHWVRLLAAKKVESRDSKWSWVTLASSVMITFASFGFLYNIGIVYNYLLLEFKDTKEKTAWVTTIPMFLQFLFAWLANWAIKRIGLRVSAMAAAIPLGASLVVTSYATNLDEMIFTFSVPFGLVCCILLASVNAAVPTYFNKRMSLAFGIVTGGCGLLQVALTYLIISLLDNFGLYTSLRILGAVLCSICFISALAFAPTKYETGRADNQNPKGFQNYLLVLKNKRFLIFLLANIVSGFSFCVSSVHQVQFAVELGVPDKASKQFPVFSTISNAVGRLSCGLILDVFVQNKLNYYQCALIVAGLVSCVSSLLTSQTQLIAYIWLFSFLDGQVQASVPVALRHIVGLELFTEAYSMVISAFASPVLFGPPFLGFIVDKTKDYGAFFYVAGAPLILAGLLLMAMKCTKEDINNKDEDIEKWIISDKEGVEANFEKDEQIKNRLLFETSV